MLTIRNYVRAQSLEEAYELNQKKTACVMGGMMWLRMTARNIQTMIDLSGLGLNTIEESDAEFSLGAMVTLRQLETHPGLNAYTGGCVKKAVEDIVGVQFRNGATLGGSVYGRFGFSDVIAVLLALDTYVEMYKGGLIPLAEFVKKPYDRDLLVRVIIKKEPLTMSYQVMRAQRTDFPVLNCAVAKAGDTCRVSIGARPSVATLLTDKKGTLAGGITKESAAQFAAEVAAAVRTGRNSRGSAAYRTHLAKVLTERAVLEIGGLL